MALHSGALDGLGQVGDLLSTSGDGGGDDLANIPPHAAMVTAAPSPAYIPAKYAPTPYVPLGGDPYANGGGGGLVSYTEEIMNQPPSAVTMPMQRFAALPQRLIQPPAILNAGYCMQPRWNSVAPGPPGAPGEMISRSQRPLLVQQQQPNFDDSLMNNGGTVTVSYSSPMPSFFAPGCGNDRRLVTPPITPMPDGSFGPRFAPTSLYHHNPDAASCIPQQSSTAYTPMPPHHHDPNYLDPSGFAGAPMTNGRFYMPSPQGNASTFGAGPRMRAAASMPFSYISMTSPTSTMGPVTVPSSFPNSHGPPLLQPDQQGPAGRKTESSTTKKRRTKTTRSRGGAARGGNGRGAGVNPIANAQPRVVTVGPPPTPGLVGPVQTQLMEPSLMLPSGVCASPQSPLWGSRPPGAVMTNGAMTPMPPPPLHHSTTSTTSCGLPPKAVGPPLPSPKTAGHTSLTLHQNYPNVGASTVMNGISSPSLQSYAPPILHSHSPGSTAERLVCPITNGTVVRPMVLQLDDDQVRQSPNALQIRSFEFDVSKNHLDTIVERPDLDIVVCSHLAHEPLQVCHWPVEAVHIRFNGTVFQLDRTTTVDNQPAHRVCGVKALCRPSRNVIEVFLSPSLPRASPHLSNYNLKDHRFAVFMAHMPAVGMVLDGLLRRAPDESLSLTKLIISSWHSRHASGGSGQDQRSATLPLSMNQSFAAEISLVCPVFRTRMQIPGRLVGCNHLEVFDMEAYLHRETIWSRLLCPICGNGSPAGLDNLYIDYFLLNIIQSVPKTVSTIHVSSDGFWRLSPPLLWQLPPGTEQWQPIVGPPTHAFAYALKVGPMAPSLQSQLSTFHPQQLQQQPVAINGLKSAGRHSCDIVTSVSTAGVPLLSRAYADSESFSECQQNPVVNSYYQISSTQGYTGSIPALSNCAAQVVNSESSSSSSVTLSAEEVQIVSTSLASQSTGYRKRIHSTSNASCGGVLRSVTQIEGQALPSRTSDFEMRSETLSGQTPPPRSPPSTPTLLNLPPTAISTSRPPTTNDPCKNSGEGVDESGVGKVSTISPSQLPAKWAKLPPRHLTREEILWAFDGIHDLNCLNIPAVIRFIKSLS